MNNMSNNNRKKNDFNNLEWRTQERNKILKPIKRQGRITNMLTYSLIGIVLGIVVILITQAINELWR